MESKPPETATTRCRGPFPNRSAQRWRSCCRNPSIENTILDEGSRRRDSKGDVARAEDARSPLAPAIGKAQELVIHSIEVEAILWETVEADRQSPNRERNLCWSAGGLEPGCEWG
jgi:hypothetical protein